eukprot:CAMPEP_0172645744 /NCGR_PEP_ID=MMETSP1068-20121228/239889_1 /TAXON_ID=35684 /ORGANISM="Pseudopedinella elastica, Strain CCMP716" /LENGTH=585 /DNA_ID=CAMNT_0013459989 /DNA_START=409 /DNA_END=2166 /DNA_ORIENTATION=+
MVPQSLAAHPSNPKGSPAKAPPSRKPKAPAKATAQDKMRGVPPEAYPQEEMPCHLVQFPIVATRHLFQRPSARPSAGAANASLTPEALSLRSGSRSGSSRRLSGSHHHHHNLKSGPQGGGGSRGRGPGSSGGEDEDPLLLWQSGTDAMGNAMLGFLTTYWDAMRAGRRLVASRYGMIQVLSQAFDLGLDYIEPALDLESDKNQCKSCILFDYSLLERPRVVTYIARIGGPYVVGGHVACSRRRNFHFDRPNQDYIGCYARALGCLRPPTRGINPTKTSNDRPEDRCGESRALRHLIVGPSRTLRNLAPILESHWAGRLERLRALLFETHSAEKVAKILEERHRQTKSGRRRQRRRLLGNTEEEGWHKAGFWGSREFSGGGGGGNSSFNADGNGPGDHKKGANVTQAAWAAEVRVFGRPGVAFRPEPIWDAALHLRVQFKFVEGGVDEREGSNVAEVQRWLAEKQTRDKLRGVVEKLRGRKSVYVASETALVRRHVADMLRAQGCEADFFMFSTASHPVDRHKGGGFGRHVNPNAVKTDEELAHALYPYLEWWALAHSRLIHAYRHERLMPSSSTYSGSAHLYGGW